MPRYFIELSYKGTAYSGFQVQENAVTIQSEVEKAFATLHRVPVVLTGSSRTDAGVHALQNYFHFDAPDVHPQFVYKMNAILSPDIAVRNLHEVADGAHSRFDAVSREYIYKTHRFKDPFLKGLSCYYPYKLNLELMQEAAALVQRQEHFFAFCKTNSQVRNYNCAILKSEWVQEGEQLWYNVEGSRFLRGMVRLLTATMLQLGRGRISMETFEDFFRKEEKCGFSMPSQGLYLVKVQYPPNYFPARDVRFSGI